MRREFLSFCVCAHVRAVISCRLHLCRLRHDTHSPLVACTEHASVVVIVAVVILVVDSVAVVRHFRILITSTPFSSLSLFTNSQATGGGEIAVRVNRM